MNRRGALVLLTGSVFLAAPSMRAQDRVLLQIRPRVGDTLRVRLDQKVEMTGAPRSAPSVKRQMTTVTEVFSRAIVEHVAPAGATVLAVTDSVRTATSRGDKSVGKPVRARGRENTTTLRVSSDGGAKVTDSKASDELRAMFGQMPAMLSRKPVAVGESWTREMRIPVTGEKGAMGLVRATFHLDSLSDDQNMAYISMKGSLSHDHSDGSNSEMNGSMTGSMKLDREVGWMVETRAMIDVTSVMRSAAGAESMIVRTKIHQHLKAGRSN